MDNKKTFNIEKDFMANEYINNKENNLSDFNNDNIVLKFKNENESESILFKDGSILKFSNTQEETFEIKKPIKEMKIDLLTDGKAGISILDNRYNKELSGDFLDYRIRRSYLYSDDSVEVSMTDHEYVEDGFKNDKELTKQYLDDIGLNQDDLNAIKKSALEIKNNLEQEQKISGILNTMKKGRASSLGKIPEGFKPRRNKL